MDILVVDDSDGIPRNLTREYGCLTLANVHDKARTYLNQNNRSDQASSILFTLLTESLTPRIANRLDHRSHDYNLNIAAAGANPIYKEDGPSLLLSLIQLVNVDTRSFVANVLARLNDLPALMEASTSDIELFNAGVDELIDALETRRASIPDIVPQLFRAYKSCADEAFVRYITAKQDSYLDRTINITYQDLMQVALEKFKTIQGDKQWCQKSARDLEFIAMQSQLNQLKQNAKPTKPPKGKTPDGQDKSNRLKGKFAWKGIAPKHGEPQEKTVNGKHYIYCPHHGETKWVLKVNLKGIEHKTGCSKLIQHREQATGTGLTAALANLTEEETEETI
jgi:hypothetical protein